MKVIEQVLEDFAERTPVRAGSLIISVFGDSISQHGNVVWLGSLIESLTPFGLNGRQIRTAVFRLIKEGWLFSDQSGRKSFYSLTEFGIRHYEKAARRIYAGKLEEWDGKWTVVIPAFVESDKKEELKKELLWLGYGMIAPGVLARPSADRQSLDETLLEMDITRQVIVMISSTEDIASHSSMQELAYSSWKLDDIAARYERFLKSFRPVNAAINKGSRPEPQQAFILRTLLIHEYRRILLSDADLPGELLPANWPGHAASDITASIYRAVHNEAMEYIGSHMENMDGSLPGARPKYYERFGGLN